MQKLYKTAQIRQVERITSENFNISGQQMMHKAAQSAFTALHQRWQEPQQLVLFCGAGNNGGDGYVLARLALAVGYPVCVYSLTDASALHGDAATAYQDFITAGGMVNTFHPAMTIPTNAIIIDALFGTGLNRPLSNEYIQLINTINASACPVLALDIPSGLQADTGCVLGAAVKADVTVTFIGLKTGLYTGEAADYIGHIVLADLDLPALLLEELTPAASLLEKMPLPVRQRCAHKGHFGHVLLIGGNDGYTGAIRLAAEAALFSGAGLVSIATRASHSATLTLNRPEIMCHAAENHEQIQSLLQKASVVVIGPGLGQDSWAQTMLATVLEANKPTVIDADALNLLAKQPSQRQHWILTPHPGEAARLLNTSTTEVSADRYAAVSAIQQRFGGVCLLKGAGTLLADAEQIRVGTTGNPGMASGGMGDVLSGVISGLLAQGLSLAQAAGLGVYVHGQAADRLAQRYGDRGLLASELFPEVRYCLNHSD
ncbi:NAD(P)H-hydrate dehydratase [Methylomonas sp. AM2-LC]|uniref:NAD(P)H-hydrate dehydratase n=1 Tax=Methylomonas sp. AM2-LC TaxID=3153301 RepID=UPI0032643AB2